uniref:Uncharacterized protein n=1 Tax=Caenorhabditis tropicalis TaxID=1561998 RepID=A0A1I7SYW0_9PELO
MSNDNQGKGAHTGAPRSMDPATVFTLARLFNRPNDRASSSMIRRIFAAAANHDTSEEQDHPPPYTASAPAITVPQLELAAHYQQHRVRLIATALHEDSLPSTPPSESEENRESREQFLMNITAQFVELGEILKQHQELITKILESNIECIQLIKLSQRLAIAQNTPNPPVKIRVSATINRSRYRAEAAWLLVHVTNRDESEEIGKFSIRGEVITLDGCEQFTKRIAHLAEPRMTAFENKARSRPGRSVTAHVKSKPENRDRSTAFSCQCLPHLTEELSLHSPTSCEARRLGQDVVILMKAKLQKTKMDDVTVLSIQMTDYARTKNYYHREQRDQE